AFLSPEVVHGEAMAPPAAPPYASRIMSALGVAELPTRDADDADPAVARAHGGASGRVLVLNASYEPINVCTMRRAAVLVLKARAEVIEQGLGARHSARLVFVRPCVIRLMRYVRVPRDVHRRKITRKAVLARDAWTCQYCGRQAHAGLTVDHVIPRSRGGQSVWENIVASCGPCN